MRDELRGNVSDRDLLCALTSTEVALVANAENLRSHSAQSAYLTAASLMARSGHQVHLLAPDVPLLETQPPYRGDHILGVLLNTRDNLVPGVEFSFNPPSRSVDLEVRIGDAPAVIPAKRSISLIASAWSGGIAKVGERWPRLDSPHGGLAAATIAAGEAFKLAMLKLETFALNPESFHARFAPAYACDFQLAPADTPETTELGIFDVISGGAIANAFLYTLARIRGAIGSGRVIDFDTGDISNLNRNMLVLMPEIAERKVDVLTRAFRNGISLTPIPLRLEDASNGNNGPLADHVIVGVDHIPTRWIAQAFRPAWLGIGATSHWSAMASYHTDNVACARCLHAADDPSDAPIPTVAFVSFLAGLLLSSYFMQALVGRQSHWPQQTYLTPLRPELPWRTPVKRRPSCPLCMEWVKSTPQ